MSAKLSLRGVRKRFGDHEVCKGIDLDVADGEMGCLIGASGSAPSTLLRCMNLLEPIDDGEIGVNHIVEDRVGKEIRTSLS